MKTEQEQSNFRPPQQRGRLETGAYCVCCQYHPCDDQQPLDLCCLRAKNDPLASHSEATDERLIGIPRKGR